MVRCLYEVLDVEKDADDGVIRLAYRKAALRWHPGAYESLCRPNIGCMS